MSEYKDLHSEFKNSAEYRPGEPNIELYIRNLNIVMNIDPESEHRALHSDVNNSVEYRPVGLNIELYIQMLNVVLNIDLEGRL